MTDKEQIEENLITKLWQAANDDEALVLTDLLVKADLRWQCKVCGWVAMPEDDKCDNGHEREKET